MKLVSTTPRRVNRNVLGLRRKLGLTAKPVYVPVTDTESFLPNHCFPNVQQKIKMDGGAIQHGWTIWECRQRYVEGEFHAVWISPDGQLKDITPKIDGERHILFIPDPVRVYEGKRVSNVMHTYRCCKLKLIPMQFF